MLPNNIFSLGQPSDIENHLPIIAEGQRLFVVYDTAVESYWFQSVQPYLTGIFKSNIYIYKITQVETRKTPAEVASLANWLASHSASKQDILFALGGGALSDLVGFTASVYKRGMPLWLYPTTLLALVDAALGGKTAVNLLHLKNGLGSFYNADYTFCCSVTLKTLAADALASGYAEMLKHAIIGSEAMFDAMPAELPNADILASLISDSQQIKLDIVAKDPQEANLRKVLNLGHTVGHALEINSENLELQHGHFVGFGILVEAQIAYNKGMLTEVVFQKIVSKLYPLFGNLYQDGNTINTQLNTLIHAMLNDKKSTSDTIFMALPSSLGNVNPVVAVSNSEAEIALKTWLIFKD